MKALHSLAFAASVAALVASAPAQAQHRGHHGGARLSIGIGVGVPFYGYRPPYHYHPWPRYYYYPPVAVVPAQPPVYIERQDLIEEQFQAPPVATAPQAQAQNDWFYCPDSKAWYPYVQQCAVEWQRVKPQPQAGR